jgi:hypothetical protein
VTSTTKGPEKSEWCQVAVTVTNEVTKSDAWKRRRDLRESRTNKVKGEYHCLKCMSGGVVEEKNVYRSTHLSLFLTYVALVDYVRVNLEKEKFAKLTKVVSTEFNEEHTYGKKQYSWYCRYCKKDPCLFVQILSNLYDQDKKHLDGILARYENLDDVMKARRFLAYKLASILIRGEMGKMNRKRHFKCVEQGVHDIFPAPNGQFTGYKEASRDSA